MKIWNQNVPTPSPFYSGARGGVPSENLIRVDSAMDENRIMIFRHENVAPVGVDLVLHSVQVGTAT